MKFILSTMLFVFSFFFNADAQRAIALTGTDIIATTATVNLTITVPAPHTTATFQVVNTKLSGTAAGNSLFQASNDGTNYITLDTLVNTNVTTNTKIFEDSPAKYRHYRISTTGSGTMSVITRAWAVLKKT